MIVWHVCSYKKLQKYIKTGAILPPVRAWKSIEDAKKMSISTGRRIILRLKFIKYQPLYGHKQKAVVSEEIIFLNSF